MFNPKMIHFEIPADDVQRAVNFYSALFGWKIEPVEGMDYWMVDSGEKETIQGGLMKRQHPSQQILDYIGVSSVSEYAEKAAALGAKILVQKTPVPGIGYFVICMDTENNVFGLFEPDMKAK